MPEEKPKRKVKYEITSREPVEEVTSEGRRIPGFRITFSTDEIPYERFFIPKKEYSKERVKKEIAKRIKEFAIPPREVGEVEV